MYHINDRWVSYIQYGLITFRQECLGRYRSKLPVIHQKLPVTIPRGWWKEEIWKKYIYLFSYRILTFFHSVDVCKYQIHTASLDFFLKTLWDVILETVS